MNTLKNKNRFIDYIGLMFIGLISLGYVIWVSPFAELHIQLPFLDFPIFIGELLLFLCLVLFFIKYNNASQWVFRFSQYLLVGYFIFVIGKTFWGYLEWGPLAFRNAALLYYPAFAILGFSFYRREIFDKKECIFLVVAIIFLLVTRAFNAYFLLTLLTLGCVLAKSYPPGIIRWIIFSLIVICAPYTTFFQTARMMIVSNFISGVYLVTILPVVLGFTKKIRRLLALAGVFFVVLGIFYFADHNSLKSIVDVKNMSEVFRFYDKKVQADAKFYKMKEYKKVELYNPNIGANKEIKKKVVDQIKKELQDVLSKKIEEKKQVSVKREKEKLRFPVEQVSDKVEEVFIGKEVPEIFVEEMSDKVEEVFVEKEVSEVSVEDVRNKIRKFLVEDKVSEASAEQAKDEIHEALVKLDIQGIEDISIELVESVFVDEEIEKMQVRKKGKGWVGNNNSVFRLLIWRDMLVEFFRERPIFGFDFGKPLRSISLEILNWGESEWGRDGWVGAHNSYLHIIYRMGVVGLGFILIILWVLVRMVRQSIQAKSVTGILLCGIIINWFVAANFLLIFELPYTAIPIWTIYGMTLAYCRGLKPKNAERGLQ